MSAPDSGSPSIAISVENIGGIEAAEVELDRGVTVLAGRNATNRTSLLRAVQAALGSDDVALKGDAEAGSVELTIDGTAYTRRLERRDGTVVFDGDPYLDDPADAELFAFLLESNDARLAVQRGEDLADVVMRPVDTAAIDEEIGELAAERDELESELAELDRLQGRLPELEAERERLGSAVEETRAELADVREELDALEAERDGAADVEERFGELRDARNELERARNDLEDEEQVLAALREERSELEASLDGLAGADAEAIESLETEIAELRERAEAIDGTVTQLQSAIQFNGSLLDESGTLPGFDRSAPDSPTDQLVRDETFVCWTCGSEVDRDAVESTIELLRETHREKVAERDDLRAELDELESERRHLERTRDERARLRRELEETEAAIEERRDRLEGLREEKAELEATLAEVESAVDDLGAEAGDDRLALHREVTELEVELDRLEGELEAVEGEIEGVEEALDGRPAVEERLEEVEAGIDGLRSRIDRIRSDVVAQFNDHMDAILELLEFENLERIWLEQVGGGEAASFDLHVVRTTGSGSVYEDTVDHLSESEREVLGLVFALSGYLVHEVHEELPFMLLDSLEAIDAGRIGRLVEYLAEHAEVLVVALLPEDADAVDDRYARVTEI